MIKSKKVRVKFINLPDKKVTNGELTTILHELEEGKYVMVIADRKSARLFFFEKGEMLRMLKIRHSGVSKKIKSNSGEIYGRNDKYMRHIGKKLDEHIERVIKKFQTLVGNRKISGIFIGGHKPMFHMIEEALPLEFRNKVRGEMVTELKISDAQLIDESKNILAQYEAKIAGFGS